MKPDLANSRQEFDKRSTDICLLLKRLEGKHFTDSGVLEMLQDIRNKVMATKGGVQRLVKAGCVLSLVGLFHRHVYAEGVRDKEGQSECGINVAVSILANMFMDSEARSQIKRDGIETLVTILTDTSNEEVQIRCSRALGNLAMDTSAVKTIAQAKALPCLVKLLRIQYIEKDEELVDRILPVSDCAHSHTGPAEVMQQASAERLDDPVIVEKFPSVALVQAVCRTVRYLADDARVRFQLVEEGVVGALALLLKTEKPEIDQCTLRALFHFWTKMNKRITERMACEVAQAGAIPNLMKQVKSGLNETAQQAFTVLLPLTEHPRTAALIGASGGVTFFLSLYAQLQSQFKQTDVVSGLCHLAREAVNRVKIREEAGLLVFLETLQDDRLKAVHDRVISCLLNFLYDDASLNSMLHDGLLDLLLNHLQRCSGYGSQMPVNILEDAKLLLAESDPKDCLAGSHFVPEREAGSECERLAYDNSSHLNPFAEEEYSLHSKHLHSSVQLELKYPEKVMKGNAVDSNVENIQSAVENSSETAVKQRMQALGQRTASDSTEEDGCENSMNQRDPTYSMNSPTYEPKTTWSMEDYHRGVTHKSFAGSGFPYSPDCDRSSPLSPLSTDTYYSPTHVAQFSPLQSSCMSPADTDAAFSPIYSPGYSPGGSNNDISECGEHQECASPKTVFVENLFPFSQQSLGLSPQSLSPLSLDSPTSNTNSGVLLFSSSEDEDVCFVNDTLQNCYTPPPVARREQHGRVNIRSEGWESFQHRLTAALMTSGHVSQLMTETGVKCEEAAQQPLGLTHSVKRFLNMDHNEDECLDKGQASMICQPGKYARTSETNILILLSRISFLDDPSQLLAKPAVISCLVNYLSLANQPQDRCERIMSRVMSSPNYLASLLSMCAPAVIVKGCLLQPAKGVLAPSKSLDSSCSTKLQYGTVHSVMQEKDALHSSAVSDDCFSPQAVTCDHHILLSVEMQSQASTLLACGQDQGQDLKVARTGLKLLSDLSTQAMSPYGQGVIINTLQRRSPPHQLLFAISLLFLLPQWSTEKQRKFLFHFGTLEKILSALCRSHPTSRITKDVAVMGLVFLLQHLKVASRFEAQKTRHLLQRVIDNMATEADNNKTDKVPEREMICQTFGTSVDHKVKEMRKPMSASSQDGLQTSLKSSCAYAASVKDLQLVTDMCDKLPVNRDALIRNSAMFAAMLKGGYVESKQSEIAIQNTNPEALCFVLHFLHGCTAECQVVSYFEQMGFRGTGQSLQNVSESSKDKNDRYHASEQQNTLLLCYNAISIADRFLIPELVQYLDCVLSLQLLNAAVSIDVFRFAVFYSLTGLAEDSLLTLLLSHQPLANIAAHVIDLAESETGSDLVSAMTGLVVRCLPRTG